MTTVQITLPDQLAAEAQRAGLLTPARIERFLREQLKSQRVDELFEVMAQADTVDEPVMTPEQVAEEIRQMRAERRAAAAAAAATPADEDEDRYRSGNAPR
jgi:hypothetical protein